MDKVEMRKLVRKVAEGERLRIKFETNQLSEIKRVQILTVSNFEYSLLCALNEDMVLPSVSNKNKKEVE